MRISAQIFDSNSPFFVSEEANTATFSNEHGQLNIEWVKGSHHLVVQATRKKKLHYCGQLLDADTKLPLMKVAIDPVDTIFKWRIQIIERQETNQGIVPVYHPLYDVLLQPLILAPEAVPFVIVSGEHYLLSTQFAELIESYLVNHPLLWDFYYSSCGYEHPKELTKEDLLSLSITGKLSNNLPDTMEILWNRRDEINLKLGLIPDNITTDSQELLELFNYILELCPAISLLGASWLLARFFPQAMPLLGGTMQSWYCSIDDDICLKKILHDIAKDLNANQAVLNNVYYKGTPIAPALAWSLALIALTDSFVH